jgi:uncharacterized protein
MHPAAGRHVLHGAASVAAWRRGMAQPAFPSPVDLEALDAFLRSERAPADCMDLSELDGFLAGLAAGPAAVPWREALPVIWGGDTPGFAHADQSAAVLGAIVGRHDEIATALRTDPASYVPVFWEDLAGTVITEDWAVGFMRAVGLRPDVWRSVLAGEDSAMLLIPIGIIAGMAEPEMRLEDADLPDALVDTLLAGAGTMLPACVRGLHAFWRQADADGSAAGH